MLNWIDEFEERTLRDYYEEALSVSDLLFKLGQRNTRGSRETLKGYLTSLGISWEILAKRGESNSRSKRVSLDSDFFSEHSYRSSKGIKGRLLRKQLVPNECSICSIAPIWEGKPLVLVLDHINGNHTDNRISNLRLLCPNCNSQQPTFCRNKRQPKLKVINQCSTCGLPTSGNLCQRCNARHIAKLHKKKEKIAWPSPEKLAEMLWSKPTLVVAKELGVSDTAISHFCKKHGIQKPPRGYWSKLAAMDGVPDKT